MARLTLIEIARHLDMSEANASTMTRALGIDRDLVTLDDVRIAYVRDLREKAAGRGGDDQAALTRARTREAVAGAQIKETQFLESCGALVAVEKLEPLLEQWVIVARSEVSNAVDKIIADIQGRYEIEIDQGIINGHIDAAYRLIAAYPGRSHAAGQQDVDGDDETDSAEMGTAAG